MKFQIHHTPSEDYFIIEGSLLDDVRTKVNNELISRGWKEDDCWSELIEY